MSRRALALALCVLTACTESQAPQFVRPPDAVDVIVDFCFHTPSWVAFKNDGYDWWLINNTRTYASKFLIPSTPRTTVAFGFESDIGGDGGDYSEVFVYSLTAAELATMGCGPALGTNIVKAPIAGVQDTDQVRLTLGSGFGVRGIAKDTASIYGVPTGMQDLVATQRIYKSLARFDKIIVRHDVTVNIETVLAPLKFDSSEAVAPVPTMFSSSGTTSLPISYLITNRGAVTALSNFFTAYTDSIAIALPPASVLAPGDGFVVGMGSTTRFATRYFTAPAPQTIPLGPALLTPTVTALPSSKTPRYRMQLPSQPEYPSLAMATFADAPYGHRVHVAVTAAYLGGTPATWDMEIPDDLTKVVNAAYLLVLPQSQMSWTAEAWDARMPLYWSIFGATDGETTRCALANSPGGVSQSSCRAPLGLIFF